MNKNTIDEFWSHVDREGPVPAHMPHLGACFVWTGSRPDGYGRMRFNGKRELVHRIAWRIEYGDIGEGKYICHHCDNPACVRASHLFEGDQFANMQDCARKRRFPDRSGAKHPRAKLTVEQVTRIRALYADGASSPELARQFGVSPWHINKIVRGENYKLPGMLIAAPRPYWNCVRTEQLEQILRLKAQGLSQREIARWLRMTPSLVCRRLKKYQRELLEIAA